MPTTNTHETRVKLRYACEACRKRKAKCTGVAPCTQCKNQKLACVFDYDRLPRGRRPKQTLLPSLTEVNDRDETALISSPLVATAGPPDPAPTTSLPANSRYLDLKALLATEDMKCLSQFTQDSFFSIVFHLTDTYWTHVNSQHGSILPPLCFFESLGDGKMPLYLCYAICTATLKYSAHRTVRGSRGQELGNFFYTRARQSLRLLHDKTELLPKLQALCVLILHEASLGHGLQAWYDIAAANGILNLIRNDSKSCAASKDSLILIQNFLKASEYLHVLGHDGLECCDPWSDGLKPSETLDIQDYHETRLFVQLVRLLAYIQRDATKSFTSQSPPPWNANSRFMELLQTLNEFRLYHANRFYFTTGILKDLLCRETGPSHYIIFSLMWHCCVISLNRCFLPIAIVQDDSMERESASRRETIDTIFNFPSPCKTFLKSRISACISSASYIAVVCRQLMEFEYFLSPVIGYTCFQAALVLINQLRCGDTSDFAHVNLDLRTVMTVLTALRRYYNPCNLWVETLVHLQNAPAASNGSPTLEMFDDFFSRFGGIREPPFATMEPVSPEFQGLSPSKGLDQRNSDMSGSIGTMSPKSSHPEEDWIQDYQARLQEGYQLLDETSRQNHVSFDSMQPRVEMNHNLISDQQGMSTVFQVWSNSPRHEEGPQLETTTINEDQSAITRTSSRRDNNQCLPDHGPNFEPSFRLHDGQYQTMVPVTNSSSDEWLLGPVFED